MNGFRDVLSSQSLSTLFIGEEITHVYVFSVLFALCFYDFYFVNIFIAKYCQGLQVACRYWKFEQQALPRNTATK